MSLGALRRDEALVNKRGRDQDDRHADERANPVELVEIAQVMQEKLGQRQTKQGDAGITRCTLLDSRPDDDEREREERHAIE